jgi:hypothetical protein
MILTDIYRIFHQTAVGYPFFSADHEMFFKIDNILRHSACCPPRKRKNEIYFSTNS